ncbi:MAG: hypothetical protein FJY80_03935 [Candidatus Aminicenantes bacterium]|nr:hypothetical protein [Candidatus Aminicenantes bacterium]
MKKSTRIVLWLALAGLALAQQVVEERVTVVNVEIPVRVFQGDRFVDNLTISDFELLENGKPQALEAVYLVKRRAIERRDEVKRFAPQTNRSFFLIFEISEYTPRIGDALDYFLRDVIMPGDSLTVGTPMKSYRLKPKAFEARSREEISAQLKTILRRDTIQGGMEYRDIILDLEGLAQAITVGLSTGTDNMAGRILSLENAGIEFQGGQTFDEQLNTYAQMLSRLDMLRSVDQGQLLAFADVLKTEAGQKYVYMFYEREFVPKIQPRLLYQYIDLHQDRPDINQTIQGIFEFYKRDVPFDVAKVKRSFADASTAIHFLLMTPSPKQSSVVVYAEQSEDIFSAFSEMALATGGFIQNSANPLALMKDAVEASETYYLLYYTPRPYTKDGAFHEVKVRVKSGDYRVVHRAGYIAN